jgi:putative cell wall-binding protein
MEDAPFDAPVVLDRFDLYGINFAIKNGTIRTVKLTNNTSFEGEEGRLLLKNILVAAGVVCPLRRAEMEVPAKKHIRARITRERNTIEAGIKRVAVHPGTRQNHVRNARVMILD